MVGACLRGAGVKVGFDIKCANLIKYRGLDAVGSVVMTERSKKEGTTACDRECLTTMMGLRVDERRSRWKEYSHGDYVSSTYVYVQVVRMVRNSGNRVLQYVLLRNVTKRKNI